MTEIFAHRGASGYAPENTLEAFRLAMEQGADGIELDVHLTKDGEVVVIHDETLNRTSDGQGKVRDYTLEELKKFSFHNHIEKYKGVQIPTLKEVLDLVENSSMKVNIELKTGIYWYEGIEEKTMEIVKEKIKKYENYFVDKVSDIKVKEQKRRWASCTGKNAILFNWRCSMAREDVIEYIVVHEMCHFEHRDHSKNFWNRVESILPDYQKQHEYLKVNGINMYL